ncbi:unnamed protein product [Closterium sp. Naga37s-1]|nr:unnamed protein product [Closterium sp. Naga37s-1]
MAVPREQWKSTDFVVDDMVYSSIDVLVMDALRHLQTLEKNSTLRLYTSFIYHYKKWAARMLKLIHDKLPHEHRLRHIDEIGHYIRANKKKDWCNEAEVPRRYIWLHGPRVTETRLRAYVKQMSRECNLIVDHTEKGNEATAVGSTTVHTILGRIKACQMAARVEATLYREKELGIMREISVVRSEELRRPSTRHHRRYLYRRTVPPDHDEGAADMGGGGVEPAGNYSVADAVEIPARQGAHATLPPLSPARRQHPRDHAPRRLLASTSSVNPDSQPVVMVIAARNSKTSKDARLQQSYVARHLEAELCAVGETGLWLHFILDQIGQFSGVDFLPPLDTTERERWYKKHLFFAKNDKEQDELPAASHQRWTRQMWTTNKVFCKRNVHAARAGGAQELAIDGTPRAEIAELGHWALDKMTRAYITAIPVGVVMRKAGYSGFKQDYFLGRSRVPPSKKLQDILAEHIFPGVDAMLRDAETRAVNGSDADKAAVHFLRTLLMFRRIVAEDLAVKLVRTPWHPYVQGSKLCRIALFQHWAKKVESVDTETIKKRRDPTQIQPEYHNMSLKEALKKEIERSALEKLDLHEKIEMQNDTIASLTAELARLAEALRVSDARRVPESPPSATEQAPSEGGSTDSANTGAGAKGGDAKPPPPPQTGEEASYELNVVQPWREAKTVRDAWRLWNSATANDTRRLCDRVAEPGFIDRHTLLRGATQGALNMRVRRMLKAMDAVRQLRSSDGDADTEAVVDALNKIAAPGIGTFCDALTVLNPGAAPTMSKAAGMGVKGLAPKVVSKLRLACALVALELKPRTWVARLFPDTWEEQMPKTEADLAKQTAPAQRPPTKRKKSA